MLTLKELCLLYVAQELERFGPLISALPRRLKSKLLKRILCHDSLTMDRRRFIQNSAFFSDLETVVLPQHDQLNDDLLLSVAESGCRILKLSIFVPLRTTNHRTARDQQDNKGQHMGIPLSLKGIAAILGHQDQLEELNLTWCIGFRPGALAKVQSSALKTVRVHADGICRCLDYDQFNRKIDHYQRDFSVLAINNPSITTLCLDGVLLDIIDCYSLFAALANSLQHLEVKVVQFYAFCQRTHCLYGDDLGPFLVYVLRICRQLSFLSCFSFQKDFQVRAFALQSSTLTVLELEGHYFERPLQLWQCANLRKLKLSINGFETEEYFEALTRVPKLDTLYISLIDTYEIVYESGIVFLFFHLGSMIKGISNINADVFERFAEFFCELTPSLKRLGIPHNVNSLRQRSNGAQLVQLVQDPQRAVKLKHLQIGIRNLCQSVIYFIAQHCVNIKTLDLAYCCTLDDYALETIAKNCRETLSVLDVSACPQITDRGIIGVASNCSLLQEINMFQTSVGDRAILVLAANCHKLRVCGVSPGSVSGHAIMKLKNNCIRRVLI